LAAIQVVTDDLKMAAEELEDLLLEVRDILAD